MNRLIKESLSSTAGVKVFNILAILFLFTIQTARADDKTTALDFSRYSQTEAFRYYFTLHSASWNLQHTNLLAISAFPTGGGFALQYSVSGSGQERDWRDVYNWAIQASHERKLSTDDQKSLRSAISLLPAHSELPPIDRLVIVSFRDGTNWVTRSYDDQSLPDAMRKIYGIVGERFEMKSSDVATEASGSSRTNTNNPSGGF